ncbi:MAG: HEPN domain-containing protein [Anaerolineales bacterium]
MKESSKQLLGKASRAIEAAETLLKNNLEEFSAGRSYYAMFYTAEALLNEKDFHFSKHGGVHAAFGEHYIKTGIFDLKFHRWLLDAYDQRIEGDYGVEMITTKQNAHELIDQAKEFLQADQYYLNA